MEEIMKLFNDYAKTFDLKNKNIMYKYHHSYRVMEYATEIAKSLKLKDEELKIVQISALFHDVARFKQYTGYQTYEDKNSFDHGDIGYTIIKDNFIDKLTPSKDYQQVILKSTKNHNKYKVEENLKDFELLVSNIVRDADKIDILIELGNLQKEEKINEEILSFLYKHEMVPNSLLKTDMDELLRLIGFIFDLNFKYSYKVLLDKKVIQNKMNLLEIYSHKDLKELEENIIKYMEEKIC